MSVLFLLLIIFSGAVSGILRKPYISRTNGKGNNAYLAVSCVSALIFFLISGGRPVWKKGIIPYSVLFAALAVITDIAGFIAVINGSISLTAIVSSLSGAFIPTVYGLVFLDESVSTGFCIGAVFLVASLVLINIKSIDGNISVKWFIAAVIMSFANGMCSVTQKIQQMRFDGAYKNEFMSVAWLIMAVVQIAICLTYDRDKLGFYLKSGWYLGMASGILTGAVNLLVLFLTSMMPMSFMFPIIAESSVILTLALSWIFFKERLSKTQLAGFISGLIAVAFFNT